MSNYSVSLKGIGIENFKAFGEYQHFDLAPLTIITGPNNSGKSALVAALELLSKNDIYSHLDLHSDGLDIGDSSQVLNSKSGSNQFVFELDFKLNPPQKFTQNIIHHLSDDFKLRFVYEIAHPKSYLKVLELIFGDVSRLTINFLEGNSSKISRGERLFFNARIDFDYFLQDYLKIYRNKYKKAIEEKSEIEDNNTLSGSEMKIRRSRKGYYVDSFIDFDGNFFNDEDLKFYPQLKTVEKLISNELSEKLDIDCSSSSIDNELFFSPSNTFSQDNNSLGKIHGVIDELLSLDYIVQSDGDFKDVNRFFDTILRHLTNNGDFKEGKENGKGKICGKIQADCNFRPKFSDSFTSFVNLLEKELKTIFLLAITEIQKTVKLGALRATNDRIYQYTKQNIPLTREIIRAAESVDRTKQGEFFKKWTGGGIERFNFFEESVFRPIAGVGYRFVVTKDGTKRELPDLGFGTRQVIPVILGLFNNNAVPFIIEEPESNLHPRLQSLLADLFIEVKNENPGSPLIIETHSEYLIRKLQYLVAKGEILAENIALTYISNNGGKLSVQKMEFRKDGILKNDFGTGFFDESVRLTMDLLTLQSIN